MSFLFGVSISIAAPSVALANVVGTDAQNFNPITSGLDFITVQSSETLEPGVFNLGLFSNYAKNTFPYYDSASGGLQRVEKQNSLLGGDLNVGVGLAHDWDAGVSFPLILNQQVSDSEHFGHYSSTGNTEVRVNTKYRLIGNSSEGIALIASANFNRIQHNPYIGDGGGSIYNLELAGDFTVGQIALGMDLGYRLRHPGQPVAGTGIEPMPSQYLASLAASYFARSIDTKVIAEVLGAIPESGKLVGATVREYSVLEALLGIKYEANSNLALHIGGGTGLIHGVSSPDYRVYAGLNFSFGPLFGKKSLQADPYYPNGKLVRYQRRRVAPSPSPSQASAQIIARSPAPLKPAVPRPSLPPKRQAPTTSASTVSSSPSDGAPALAPSFTPDPPAQEVVRPSVNAQNVQKVRVFDRGSYNHIVINRIEFVSGSDRLTPESKTYLIQDLVPALRELAGRRSIGSIIVEGHTDSIGSPASNLQLSRDRSKVVADVLRAELALNVPIRSIGLGDTSPIADNGNFQGRALNRRVELKLMYQRSSN